MPSKKLTEEELLQHQSVLLSAETNLNIVIDQIASLQQTSYKKISEALEDAYHELKTTLKKV